MNHPIAIRLREKLRQQPFRPFRIRLVDGTRYEIPHEDFMGITRSGAVTYDDGEGAYRTLNVTLILEIEDIAPN